MSTPEIKILAVSNVYCRLMYFKNRGDVQAGHCHTYDHGTLLSTGRLQVDMFSEDNIHQGTKIFEAPTFIFIRKDAKHQLTALEDNTVAVCIHALRTIEDDIIDSSFFVTAMQDEQSVARSMIRKDMMRKHFTCSESIPVDKLKEPEA